MIEFRELYTNIDPKLHHPWQMSYKVVIKNKIVDISAQRIKSSLWNLNIGDTGFKLEWYIITNEDLLTKPFGSLGVGVIGKWFFIPGEFTHFYQVLNKMVCSNLLPSKHSYKIGHLHEKILYCLRKHIVFNVSLVILNEVINQSQIVRPRIGLSCSCLITQMILTIGVQQVRYYDTIFLMKDIENSTMSRSWT